MLVDASPSNGRMLAGAPVPGSLLRCPNGGVSLRFSSSDATEDGNRKDGAAKNGQRRLFDWILVSFIEIRELHIFYKQHVYKRSSLVFFFEK